MTPKIDSAHWQLERSERGAKTKLFDVRFDHMMNTRTGKGGKMTILEMPDAVNVLALNKEGAMVLVRQYRFGIGYDTLELPGGIVDEGEDSLQAAKRELLEETGHSGGQWQYLGSVPSNPVFIQGRIHHWMAQHVEQTHELQLDDGEDIEVVHYSIEEVKALLQNSEIEHPHTLSALFMGLKVWG